LLGILFNPEDLGNIFLRIVGWLSTEYKALYRVIQEELPPLMKLISEDILSKKCHINLVTPPESPCISQTTVNLHNGNSDNLKFYNFVKLCDDWIITVILRYVVRGAYDNVT
jgi:hypothetical protein